MTRIPTSLTAGAVLALLSALAPVSAGAQEAPAGTMGQPNGAGEPAAEAERPAAPEGLYALRVKEVSGKQVANVTGDKLGDVEKVVRGADDGRLYVLVSVGGFLGIGDKQVALPVDDLQLSEEQLVMTTDVDEETLKQQAGTFQEDQYQEITDEDLTLADAIGAGGAGAGSGQELPSFSTLDRDGDGMISRQEASDSESLMSNWGLADQDQDGQLTESEFSAFEQTQSREQPDMQPGGMEQHDRVRGAEPMPEGVAPPPESR